MVRLRVQDNNALVSEPVSAAITVHDTNQAPTLVQPIADQTAGANQTFRFVLSTDAFVDPDAGQTLSYAAAQPDGSPLPGWLAFDSQTRTFSGRPLVRDVGQYDIRVTATDSGSPALAAWAEFTITVTPHEFPWQNADLPPDVDGSEAVTPLDVLILINWINSNGAGPVPTAIPDPVDSPLFLDVYGDNLVTAIDVLTVVNYINSHVSAGPQSAEGEGGPSVGQVSVASHAAPSFQPAEGEGIPAAAFRRVTTIAQPRTTDIALRSIEAVDEAFGRDEDLTLSTDWDQLLGALLRR
jgi:hypothetical protein